MHEFTCWQFCISIQIYVENYARIRMLTREVPGGGGVDHKIWGSLDGIMKILGMYLIFTKLIIQHKFYIDICI